MPTVRRKMANRAGDMGSKKRRTKEIGLLLYALWNPRRDQRGRHMTTVIHNAQGKPFSKWAKDT